ncbi:AsnC family transcriptional regulator [human gut metagenome]|uniref:AsnC family transcriptional regulator n=1 Tax=human gut metagenome TaxID=408170 RepID=K1TD57_9ZZZZ
MQYKSYKGDRGMREELLAIIEKNSRIDLKELAVILGVEEIDVVNELAALEAEGIICGYHTLINWEKTDIRKSKRSDRGTCNSPERPGL